MFRQLVIVFSFCAMPLQAQQVDIFKPFPGVEARPHEQPTLNAVTTYQTGFSTRGVLRTSHLGNRLVVLKNDMLLSSSDGGADWTTLAIHPRTLFAGDGTSVFATTPGSIFETTDRGQVWRTVRLPVAADNLNDVELYRVAGHYYAVISGEIYSSDKTTDWQEIGSPCNPIEDFEVSDRLMATICDSDKHDPDAPNDAQQYVGIEEIRVTADRGATWTTLNAPPEKLDEIYLSGEFVYAKCIVKGQDILYRYSSGGDWSLVLAPTSNRWPELAVASAKGVLVPTTRGLIFVPNDGSANKLINPPGDPVEAVAAEKDELVVVQPSGTGPKLSYSADSGNSWSSLPSTGGAATSGLSISSGVILLKSSPQALILKIGDPGGWRLLNRVVSEGRFRDFAIIKNRILLVGNRLSSSDNEGLTWTKTLLADLPPKDEARTIAPTGFFPTTDRIHFDRSPNGEYFAFAENIAYGSHDGLEWKRILPPQHQLFLSMVAQREAIYALTFDGGDKEPSAKSALQLSTTVDEGRNWISLTANDKLLRTAEIKAIVVDSKKTIYICGARSILKGTLSGSWENIANGVLAGRTLQSFYLDDNDVLHVGTNTGLFWSNDGGQTWNQAVGELSAVGKSMSIKEIISLGHESFMALTTDGGFLCANLAQAAAIDFVKIPLDIKLEGEIKGVLIDGVADTDASIIQDGGEVQLRTTKDSVAGWKDGMHQLTLRTSKLGQQLSLDAYIYKELTIAKFFKPYSGSYALVTAASGKWDESEFVDLKTAVSQAREVATALRVQGFQVEELYEENATKTKIEESLAALDNKMSSEDRLVFYFSGHGYTPPGTPSGYLLAFGATKSNIKTKGISVTSVEYEFASNLVTKPKHALFVLDACFAGLPTDKDPISPENLHKFLEYQEIRNYTGKRMRAILSAGEQGEPALDINGGIFTKAFLEGLKGGANLGGDEVITVDRLYDFVRRSVIDEAIMHGRTQTPKLSKLSSMGDGTFIFLEKP